jgi:hypothetical protein
MPTTPISTWGMGRLDPFMDPDEAHEIAVNLKPSTTYAKGTLLGELTATPGVFAPYTSGAADGSQNPKLLLRHDCVTDAQGYITYGSGPAGTSEHLGQVSRSTDAFYSGTFKTQDVPNLDQAALDKIGRLISGVLANGIFVLQGP